MVQSDKPTFLNIRFLYIYGEGGIDCKKIKNVRNVHWRKLIMSMKEALENYFARLESSCQNITGEYNIYCSNCIGIGLQNMWDVWETAPYIRKLDGAANTYSTELIDFTYTEKLRNSFGWK